MSDLLLRYAEILFPGDEDIQEAFIAEYLAGNIDVRAEDMRAVIQAEEDLRKPPAVQIFDKGRTAAAMLATNYEQAIRHFEAHPSYVAALEWFEYAGKHNGTFVAAVLNEWEAGEIADAIEAGR